MKSPGASWTSAVFATIGIGCLLMLLAFFFDQPAHLVSRYPGVIVDTYTPGKWRTGTEMVQVRLETGALVVASIPVLDGFPYSDGTAVTVTAWDSLVFGKRSYAARVLATSPGA
jgi:hypothetical protein